MSKIYKKSLWIEQPIETIIMSILSKDPKKVFEDDELYNKVKDTYEYLSYNHFIKALINLEIWGKISVVQARKGKKLISLNTS
ncbi:MAG: hypothetical protein QXX09_04645 [Candidatus Methanomethylicia archaeon]